MTTYQGSLGAASESDGYKVFMPLPKLRDEVSKEQFKAWKAMAPIIRDSIKALAPVDTGALKQSIKVKAIRLGNNVGLQIRTVYYGLFQEEGTINHPPQAFIQPGIANVMDQLEAELKAATARARVIREEAERL